MPSDHQETLQNDTSRSPPLHVAIVVMGDVGRSPRMQYHALSCLQLGYRVTLLGYAGEDLIEDLRAYTKDNGSSSPSLLRVQRFSIPKSPFKSRLLYLAWRFMAMAVVLCVQFCKLGWVDCIMVQNPPAVPLLLLTWLYTRFMGLHPLHRWRRPLFIVDWHNLGYAMFTDESPSSRESRTKKYVQWMAQQYELCLAPWADKHFTVTVALREYLLTHMKLPNHSVHVVKDAPPVLFQPLSTQQQHELWIKLSMIVSQNHRRHYSTNFLVSEESSSFIDETKTNHVTEDPHLQEEQTLFTERIWMDNNYVYRPRVGRPALVTSSTSWTQDEDFHIFFQALQLLDQHITNLQHPLRVVVVVTGKGPQRLYYEEQIQQQDWKQICIQTMWLDPVDYPQLIACSDLAVSLHTSTSGLDLPMKILDSYGCQVPVCAKKFDCLHELVVDGVHGRIFDTADELSRQLWELLSPIADNNTKAVFPHSVGALQEYSLNLQQVPRWKDAWGSIVRPILKNLEQRASVPYKAKSL